MRFIILNILILGAQSFAVDKPLKCKDIRTGTFENKTREAWIIKTKDKQIEKSKADSSFYTEWRTHYFNDCEYLMILTVDKSKVDPGFFAIGDTIKVSIGEILKDRYLWTSVYKDKTFQGLTYITKK